MNGLTDHLPSRSRLGWWAFVLLLGVAIAYVVGSFIGLTVLGLFGYYATRPICVRLRSVTGSRQLAATLTALSVLVPILLLLVVVGPSVCFRSSSASSGTGNSSGRSSPESPASTRSRRNSASSWCRCC